MLLERRVVVVRRGVIEERPGLLLGAVPRRAAVGQPGLPVDAVEVRRPPQQLVREDQGPTRPQGLEQPAIERRLVLDVVEADRAGDEVEGALGHRQVLEPGDDAARSGQALPGELEHLRGRVHEGEGRVGEAGRHRGRQVPGPCAQLQDRGGRGRQVAHEPLEHLVVARDAGSDERVVLGDARAEVLARRALDRLRHDASLRPASGPGRGRARR